MTRYKLRPHWWITFELNDERIVGRTTVDGDIVYITSYGSTGKIPFDKVEKPSRLYFRGALGVAMTIGRLCDVKPS